MRAKTFPVLMLTGAMTFSLVHLTGCESRDEEVVEPAPAAPAEPAEPAAAEATVDEATRIKFETLVKQVTEHIRKGELEGADTGLRELEKMSANLPEAMKQQVATVRAALAAARTSGTTPAPGATPAPAPPPTPPAQ